MKCLQYSDIQNTSCAHSILHFPDKLVFIYLQGFSPKVDDLASKEICHLQQQNNTLRAVVAQMRKDMENLGYLLPQSQFQSSSLQPVDLLGVPNTHTTSNQMATGPPAQPSDNSCKPNPAGMNHTNTLKFCSFTFCHFVIKYTCFKICV